MSVDPRIIQLMQLFSVAAWEAKIVSCPDFRARMPVATIVAMHVRSLYY